MKGIVSRLFLAALLCCTMRTSAICTHTQDGDICPPGCGDGVCSVAERNSGSCPDDCGDPVCGDGICQGAAGENGSTCGQDCCDYNTDCYQTYLNQGNLLCRRWSTNNGATWNNYSWQSIGSYNAQYCNYSSQVCVVESNCHNTYAICVHITPPTGRFEILPTASCP
ncbi:MAG TPA: hypothetical protein VF173_26165 [Thermoanaerobaculia bacterium]|nr:hypothetical protein [Thermoanaerobaculia bacterium]